MEALLNEKRVAETLGMSLAALRRWRYERRGPGYLKIGSAVRYRPEVLREWVESCAVGDQNSSGGSIGKQGL